MSVTDVLKYDKTQVQLKAKQQMQIFTCCLENIFSILQKEEEDISTVEDRNEILKPEAKRFLFSEVNMP
jgi:hypothetical protein